MNPREQDARRRKARSLSRIMYGAADVFRADGASVAEILTAFHRASPEERQVYGEAAELVRAPSAETWRMACGMLAHRLTTPMKAVG